jgi:hypothetical protein
MEGGGRAGHLFDSRDGLLSHGCRPQRGVHRLPRALKCGVNRGNGNAALGHIRRQRLLLRGQLRTPAAFPPTWPRRGRASRS